MYVEREREVEEIKREKSEVEDPKIKLFGKSIELPATVAPPWVAEICEAAQSCDAVGEESSMEDLPCSSNSMFEESNLNGDAEDQESNKSQFNRKEDDAKEEDRAQPLTYEELKDFNTTPLVVNDPKVHSTNSEVGAFQSSKIEEDQSEIGNSQEKALTKPDKILPCPRCNSMDTKFCYFNNYNVDQPRHFCKNCQRYWTAGGTMRNMPVGAGRRKNKNVASHFQHLTIPKALQSTRVDLLNGIHHPVLNPKGSVITSTSDTPPCESMDSVLIIADTTVSNTTKNGFCRPEALGMSVSHRGKKNEDDHSNGSSTIDPTSKDEVCKTELPKLILNYHPLSPQIPCFPRAHWPYPWHCIQWSAPPSLPTFAPASFPLPFYGTTPPYWGCSVPNAWNVPWVSPTLIASNSNIPLNSGIKSSTLGKHSRDDNTLEPVNPEEEMQKEDNPEKCLWVPKTLRISDPVEAAKSSIWATLGIKNDRVDSVGGGLFKGFQSQSKGKEKIQVPGTSPVLHANPAALCRSLNFHESL